MKLLARLPKQLQFLVIILLVMVALWMFVTPFYNLAMETFEVTPIVSVIIGGIVLYYGIKKFRLHPW